MRYVSNLNFETLSLLNRISKYSKKSQIRDRATCIILSFKRFEISQLITMFGVHRNTIYNYLNNWENQGLLSLYNSKGQGRKSIITYDNEQFVMETVNEYPNQLKKVIVILENEKGIKLSLDTLKLFVKKKMNFIWKRVRKSLISKRPGNYEEKKRAR